MTGPVPIDSIRATSARNTAANWLQYAIAVGLALWLTPLMIRSVGISAYGVWVLFVQMTAYAAMLDLGIQNLIVIKVATGHAQQDMGRLQPLLSTALAVGATAGLVVVVGALLAGPYLSSWFDLGGIDASVAQITLLTLALATALGFPLGLFNSILAGLQRYDLVARFSIYAQGVRAAGTLAVLALHGPIFGFGVAALAGVVVGLALAYSAAHRETGGVAVGVRHAARAPLGELGVDGFYLFVGNLGWRLAYGADALLAGVLLTARDIAAFGVAASVLVLVMGLVSGFTGTLVPVATTAAALGDEEGGARRYLVGTRVALFLGLPLAALLTLSAPELLSLWVGVDAGQPAGRILQLLAGAQIFVISNSAGVSLALGTGLHRIAAGLALLEGLLNLALSYLLAVRMGALGIAVGTLVPSALFHGIIWPIVIRQKLLLGFRRYWREALVPNLICLGAALLVWVLSASSETSSVLWPVSRAVLFTGAYWMLGFRTCFSAPERRTIVAMVLGALRLNRTW